MENIMSNIDWSSLIGKTVESVQNFRGEFIPGDVSLEIIFTDGTKLTIDSHGCDEGGWLSTSID